MKKFIILTLVFILISGYLFNQSVKKNKNFKESFVTSSQTPVPSGGPTQTLQTICSGKALPELTEGPLYKEGSPNRQVIKEDNSLGTKLTLEGYIFDTSCKVIPHAWIAFWQADGKGEYDTVGYNLRGYQYTDDKGKYKLVTVVPGLYPTRTEHIHFRIKANPSSRLIISQLFLPDGTRNSIDPIFDKSLIINMSDVPNGDGKYATYNFVVDKK